MRNGSANLNTRSHPKWRRCVTCGLTRSIVPATGPCSGSWCLAPEPAISLSLMRCRGSRFVGKKACPIGQPAMQHHSKLAGECNLGLAHPGTGRQAHPPALQCGSLHRSGQDDIGRLVERGAHTTVADLRDAAGYIGLTRLIFPGRQPEMRADGLRGLEAARIVNCRDIGERDNRAWSHVMMLISLHY